MAPGSLQIALLAAAGVVAGLLLLVRGLAGYGRAARIADTATSRIATLAIGEVRVTGTVEPAELSLISPLQSARCVFYRSSISRAGEGLDEIEFDEERAVGFRVRDSTGTVRVFPRAATFEAPLSFDESDDPWGGAPAGLQRRSGSPFAEGAPSREALVAALLTVRPSQAAGFEAGSGEASLFGGGVGGLRTTSQARRYREARIELGDTVTVVGQVLPFDQLPDPLAADVGGGPLHPLGALGDPEIAADLARARATGTLAETPEEAWGNAAIPGFGIGHPVSAPQLDPEAIPGSLATPADAARAEASFEIEPQDLVIAAASDAPLIIAHGTPGEAAERHERQFLLGLLGAVLAIGSGLVLAVALGGVLGIVSPLGLAAAFAVALLILVVAFIVLATYNAVVALQQRIDKAWANIDVALKQRWDQLPNLVEAVRDLMAFERDLLTEVTRLRSAYTPAAPIPDQAATSEATTAAVRQLFAVVEGYPAIQSNRNVLDLQEEIERLENIIADRRELYNDQVYRHNTRIAQFPAVVLAPLFGWRAREFFAAEPEATARPDATLAAGQPRTRT